MKCWASPFPKLCMMHLVFLALCHGSTAHYERQHHSPSRQWGSQWEAKFKVQDTLFLAWLFESIWTVWFVWLTEFVGLLSSLSLLGLLGLLCSLGLLSSLSLLSYLVFLVCLVFLVYLVYLVCLVCLVLLVDLLYLVILVQRIGGQKSDVSCITDLGSLISDIWFI